MDMAVRASVRTYCIQWCVHGGHAGIDQLLAAALTWRLLGVRELEIALVAASLPPMHASFADDDEL